MFALNARTELSTSLRRGRKRLATCLANPVAAHRWEPSTHTTPTTRPAPATLASDLRLPVIGEVMVRGVTGSERVSLYGVELEVAGIRVPVQVAGMGFPHPHR